MPLTLSVTTVDQALFVVNSLRMLQKYHETVKPLTAIVSQGTVYAQDKDGNTVVAAPVDYLSWTEQMDRFSGHSRFTDSQPTLYIAGAFSDMAKSKLQQRGWQLHENSELFTRISVPHEARS
jgi:hypothetical protein